MTPIIGNFLRYIGVVDASRYNVLALLNSTWTCKRRLDDSPNEYEDVLRYNSIGKILSRKLYFPFIYSLSVAPQTLLYFDKVWGLKLSSLFTCWSIRHDNTPTIDTKIESFWFRFKCFLDIDGMFPKIYKLHWLTWIFPEFIAFKLIERNVPPADYDSSQRMKRAWIWPPS